MRARCVRVDSVNGVIVATLEAKGKRKEFPTPGAPVKQYASDEGGPPSSETEDAPEFTCGRDYEVKPF